MAFSTRLALVLTLMLLNFPLTALASAPALEKTSIALNWKPEPEFGGFYAAQDGIYAKNGLQVEILPGGSGTPVVQMLAAGKIDFGIVSADEVVMSRANGSDVIALFAVFQTSPQGLMAHAERGFKTAGDVMKGDGVLAMQRGLPYAEYLVKKYPPKQLKIVPYLGGVANFLADKKFSQQVFVTAEPIEARRKGANVTTFLIADEGYNPYTVVLATRESFLRKRPDLVKAVVGSVREGWRIYLAKPEAANRKMAELNPSMDKETFKASTELQAPLIETAETRKSGLGMMSEQRWQTLIDQLSELKLIKNKIDPKSAYRNL